MRRSSQRSPQKLSADSQRLVTYSQAVLQASSRLEERMWRHHLDVFLLKLLTQLHHQDTIDQALEYAFKTQIDIYDVLMEAVEAVSECCAIEQDGVRYEVLLLAAPVLAWTRFSIASGPIPSDMLMTLSAHLYAHVLADDTRMAMAPMLYAMDQLPRTHAETFALTQHMAHAALEGTQLEPPDDAPEATPFLADIRYLLAAVVVPEGQPIFRWQELLDPSYRAEVLTQWRAQALPNISRLLPGCGVELLLPEAYYVACREADKQIRPTSLRAAVHYLTNMLNIPANELQATIGGFSEETAEGRVDEYRVGFLMQKGSDVVYGLVWPLYEQEDSDKPDEKKALTPLEQIVELLRENGIDRIKHYSGIFPMEACEDCGAPFYLDLDSELVHAEMPDDALQHTGHHLH